MNLHKNNKTVVENTNPYLLVSGGFQANHMSGRGARTPCETNGSLCIRAADIDAWSRKATYPECTMRRWIAGQLEAMCRVRV